MSEKCIARTKLGDECRAPVVVGTQLCAIHGDPARAAELGRMGGRKNRHYVETEEVNIAPPSTPEDIKNLLAQVMVDVRARKLDPRIASTLTSTAGVLLRALELPTCKSSWKACGKKCGRRRTSRECPPTRSMGGTRAAVRAP